MKRPHLRYKNQNTRERTWTIHFIAIGKFLKGAILLAVGIKLITLFNRDVHQVAEDFVTRHGIDMGNRFIESALERLEGFGNTQIVQFSAVAMSYSGLLLTEGIGLWLQKRWAEYLAAIGTALLIPFEIFEIYERFTWVRVGILCLNIFIVWYLATRLRDEKKEEEAVQHATKVKICGITNTEDAKAAVEAGADAIGLNFYEKSPRFISVDDAKQIAKELPAGILRVGVFVNESVEKIVEIANAVGLDAIQLHGDEDHEFVDLIQKSTNKEIIKAVRVNDETTIESILSFKAHAVLLDSYSKTEYGGSGKKFDWSIARDYGSKIEPLYLAGGLTVDNAAEAVREVRPFAVDVCTSVESEPGKKDHEKIRSFVAEVKGK